jgi:predicted DNA-binding transcriptional regulator YafY
MAVASGKEGPTLERIVDALLENERFYDEMLDRLEPMIQEGEMALVPLQQIARECGVTVRTIYRWCDKWGIPIRDKSGAAEKTDRSASYVARTEFEMKRAVHTRVVREEMRRAGS